MKLLTDVKTLVALLVVLCVPAVRSLLPAGSGDVWGAQVRPLGTVKYNCKWPNPPTTPKTCAPVSGDKVKCFSTKQICRGAAESGGTFYCNNGTGTVSDDCLKDANCLPDKNAETHTGDQCQ